jgi:hypothetical protein
MKVHQRSVAMLSKYVVFAAAVIFAVPVCAASAGGSSGGASSAGAGAGGHGGGGHGGSGGGASASAGGGHSGGLSGRAAAATARGGMYGANRSERAGISHSDAMRATHLAADKKSEVESTSSKIPGMNGHHHPYLHEPHYGAASGPEIYIPSCMPGFDRNTDRNAWAWFDCNQPTKRLLGRKS